MTTSSRMLGGFKSLNQELATKRAIKIKAIKTICNGLTESEHAAVILRENDSAMANMLWNRLMNHRELMRADELEIVKRLRREQEATRSRANEVAQIMAISLGSNAWFWMEASKQAVGFKFVSGWENTRTAS